MLYRLLQLIAAARQCDRDADVDDDVGHHGDEVEQDEVGSVDDLRSVENAASNYPIEVGAAVEHETTNVVRPIDLDQEEPG